MSWNIAAYIEKKTDKGWELVTQEPVGNCLKYIIDDYNELPKVKWEDLSIGMQEKFKKEENGECYYSFYSTTLEDLEANSNKIVRDSFTKVNTIVKALGCHPIYNEDGEELDYGWDEKGDKLTYPVNKDLIEDLQLAFNTIRNAGQREAFDLFLNQYMEYGSEYRVLIVYS